MSQGQGGGQPPIVFNEEQIAQVESLGAVLSIPHLCDYFGISKTTFYEICKRQPEVLERYKKGKYKAIGNVSKSLLQKALAGDTTSAIFYLKTQAGWKETQVNENSNITVTSNKEDVDI